MREVELGWEVAGDDGAIVKMEHLHIMLQPCQSLGVLGARLLIEFKRCEETKFIFFIVRLWNQKCSRHWDSTYPTLN